LDSARLHRAFQTLVITSLDLTIFLFWIEILSSAVDWISANVSEKKTIYLEQIFCKSDAFKFTAAGQSQHKCCQILLFYALYIAMR